MAKAKKTRRKTYKSHHIHKYYVVCAHQVVLGESTYAVDSFEASCDQGVVAMPKRHRSWMSDGPFVEEYRLSRTPEEAVAKFRQTLAAKCANTEDRYLKADSERRKFEGTSSKMVTP